MSDREKISSPNPIPIIVHGDRKAYESLREFLPPEVPIDFRPEGAISGSAPPKYDRITMEQYAQGNWNTVPGSDYIPGVGYIALEAGAQAGVGLDRAKNNPSGEETILNPDPLNEKAAKDAELLHTSFANRTKSFYDEKVHEMRDAGPNPDMPV